MSSRSSPGTHQTLASARGYTCAVLRPTELATGDIAAWRALCSLHSDYASPLLQPAFAQMVGRRRADVRCILLHRYGQLHGAMAVHMRSFGLARPVGAPFNDYSGPVLHPDTDISLAEVLSLAGIATYRAQNVVDPYGLLTNEGGMEPTASYAIQLDGRAPADVFETQRAMHAKRFKNYRRLSNRLADELGPPRLCWGHPTPCELQQLLAWKGGQYRRERLVDVTSTSLSARVLQETAATREADIEGFMVKLMIGDRPVAGHFGVRSGTIFHPWISAFDPDLSDYSPGMLVLLQALPAMHDMGLATYDLAAGHLHYKKYFATHERRVREVCVSGASVRGRVREAARNFWAWTGRRRYSSLPARINRNIEHVATCEAGFYGRIAQVGNAFVRRATSMDREA